LAPSSPRTIQALEFTIPDTVPWTARVPGNVEVPQDSGAMATEPA
jgi:hypothetical protein